MAVSVYQKFRTWGWKGVVDFFKRKVFERRVESWFYRNARRYPMTPERGITIIAALSQQTSLSKALRDFVLMLKKAQIPFQTFDLKAYEGGVPASDLEGIVTPKKDFRILKYNHVIEMFGGPFPDKLPLRRSRIAFWEFETGLMKYFPNIADGVDEIVAMSDFDVDVFRKQLPPSTAVKKILYPFLFDVGELPPPDEVRAKYGIGADDFVVFFNFDFGSSFGRKNPDGALRAFAAAFRDTPGTRLVFKTKGAKSHAGEVKMLQSLAAELGVADRLTFINDFIPMKDIYGLTNACDVYLSLHRGEGFGLGIAEAMSLGKPVVVTDYSSTTEFCKPDNSIPVPYRMVKVPPEKRDHACYRGVDEWAEADIDAAAQALKMLYGDAQLRTTLGSAAKSVIADHFSLSNFRKSVIDFLQ